MSQPCELPPCPPCPAPIPPPCPQICPPPPPLPPCRVKPVMRRLHWAQTEGVMAQGFALAFITGALLYVFQYRRKIAAYHDYYLKAEMEDQEDEMARKGLFNSVPPESLKDNQHMKKK